MIEIDELRKFKTFLVDTRHSERVREQTTDQEFLTDKYDLPIVKSKKYVLRTGYVAKMLNGITQTAVSQLPRVFAEPKKLKGQDKSSKVAQEAADRIASEGNRWSRALSLRSVNPFQETFKDGFIRGESWVSPIHEATLAKWEAKEAWQEVHPDAVPVDFIVYDPIVVFSEPAEEINGVPKRVVVSYKRSAIDIQATYPLWKEKENYGYDKLVEYLFYVDRDMMYAEADGEPLFREKKGRLANGDGRRKNPYGFVNFIHAYSGWGKETPELSPELLAFSRIRMIRNQIVEVSTMASDFMYNFHRFAWRHKTLFLPAGTELPANAFEAYKDEPDAVSILYMPEGSDFKVEESQTFEAPVFAYYDRLRADLAAEYPSPLRGVASGTTGRQEDILANYGLAIYDCLINNGGRQWSQAIDMAFRIINKIPGILPPNLKENDIDYLSEIRVDMKKSDPVELSRRAADGNMQYKDGIIDLETNHIEFQGRTKEDAKKIIAKIMVYDRIRNSPILAAIIDQEVASELGVLDKYEALRQQIETTGINPIQQFEKRGGPPRTGNIKTAEGLEMADMAGTKPTRMPPGMGE